MLKDTSSRAIRAAGLNFATDIGEPRFLIAVANRDGCSKPLTTAADSRVARAAVKNLLVFSVPGQCFAGLKRAVGARRTTPSASSLFLLVALFGAIVIAFPPSISAQHRLVAGQPEPDGLLGISREEDAQLLPWPPREVRVANTAAGAAVISWTGNGADNLVGYRVYRRCSGDAWTPIANVTVEGRNTGSYSLTDEKPNGDCEYAVSSMDRNGNEGPTNLETVPP